MSKVSYGYAMYNDQEGKGDALLNTNYVHDPVYESVRSRLLPGPSYNTNFILAMEYVARDTRDEIGVEPDYERYRRMQILAILQARAAGVRMRPHGRSARALEHVGIHRALGIKAIMHASYRMSFLRPSVDAKLADIASVIGVGPAPKHYGPNGHSNVVDVYEAFENGSVA